MPTIHLISIQLLLLFACAETDTKNTDQTASYADVTKITSSGTEGNYTFSVTISSPDTGCDQYADWWEIISVSGDLIYRRILLHSHVNEQPFTRSGGSVKISKDQIVWIRAHMNNSGYGGKVMKGSVDTGFTTEVLPDDIGKDLDQVEPLPEGCNF